MKTGLPIYDRDFAEEARIERVKADNLRKLLTSVTRTEIARTCARCELESDEMSTREEKARRYQ